jgi:hypothetical protein
MPMAGGGRRRIAQGTATGRLACSIAVAVVLGLAVSACTTDGQPPVAAATPRGPTVAFESIDGPPESVFQKLVQDLSDEADLRQLAVVSRQTPAQYRIRGYVAAQTQSNRSTIAWTLDVYDSQRQRALRITGEEPASASGRGTWAVADDQVLRRIAYNSMDRLVAFLASPASAASPTGPDSAPEASPDMSPAGSRRAFTTASTADDFAPESAGIFRTPRIPPPDAAPASGPVVAAAQTESQTVPLPRRRPPTAGFTSQDSLAYLVPVR